MPRASAAAAAKTSADILAAAVRLFTTAGYAATSVDDVAREAGVTRGAVYHHYGGKEGLVRVATADAHRRVADRVVARAAEHDDPVRQLRAGCHAFIDEMVLDPAAHVVLVDAPAVLGGAEWRAADAAASEPELRAAVSAVLGTRGDETGAAVQLLSGAMNQAVLWLAAAPGSDRRRAAVHRVLDALIDAVVAGGRGHPAG